MTLKRLDSGYWHARWNANQWIQWPCDRSPTLDDAFGWVTEEMVRDAALAARGEVGKKPMETVPIGKCPKCGRDVYTDVGFCGGCTP